VSLAASARRIGGLWAMCQWFDRSPRGHNETTFRLRRHDAYDSQ